MGSLFYGAVFRATSYLCYTRPCHRERGFGDDLLVTPSWFEGPIMEWSMYRLFSRQVVFFSMALSFAFCSCKDPCESYDSMDVSDSFFEYLRESNQKEAACVDYVNSIPDYEARMNYLCSHNFKGHASKYSKLGCGALRRDAFVKAGNAWKRECRITDDKKVLFRDSVVDGLFAEKSLDDDGNEIVTISFEYHLDPDAYEEYQYARKVDLLQWSEKKDRYVDLQCDESYVTVNGNRHDNYSDKFNSDAIVRTFCVIPSDMKADEFNPSRYGMKYLFTQFLGNEHDWKCDTI